MCYQVGRVSKLAPFTDFDDVLKPVEVFRIGFGGAMRSFDTGIWEMCVFSSGLQLSFRTTVEYVAFNSLYEPNIQYLYLIFCRQKCGSGVKTLVVQY